MDTCIEKLETEIKEFKNRDLIEWRSCQYIFEIRFTSTAVIFLQSVSRNSFNNIWFCCHSPAITFCLTVISILIRFVQIIFCRTIFPLVIVWICVLGWYCWSFLILSQKVMFIILRAEMFIGPVICNCVIFNSSGFWLIISPDILGVIIQSQPDGFFRCLFFSLNMPKSSMWNLFDSFYHFWLLPL